MKKRTIFLIGCPIALILLCIIGLITLWPYLLVSPENSAARFTPTPQDTPTVVPEFVPLATNVWTGVKVYYQGNEGKYYVFEIIGGSDDCTFGRGVKVQFPRGSEEWKDRDYLIQPGLYFIRGDDPALERMDWRVFEGCR